MLLISTPAPHAGGQHAALSHVLFQLAHPVRGTTPSRVAKSLRHFNSRTRVGCDDSQAQWKQSGKAISTPAPTRGATWRASVGCSSFHILTPVPHAGRDKRLQANYQFTSCFNSHTQEGGGHRWSTFCPLKSDFNSRSPCGMRRCVRCDKIQQTRWAFI